MAHTSGSSSYDPLVPDASSGSLSCADVSLTVDSPSGPFTVLDRVSCEFDQPRTAVIGLNGSGKSTLLRLFNALVVPQSGVVRVNSIDPVAFPREARAAVGFVFTDPASQILMPTPIEDIELSLRRHVHDRHERTERARDWLVRMGLEHRAHHSVFDLSGGERQLVALAAVLAAQPQVLILDEPTTLLDLRNQLKLIDMLDDLGQQQLISTHDLDLAATAHHVAVVHESRIIAQGPPAELIPQYKSWCAHGFPQWESL
ncbi:energy-coupling factor ABC transporter ATP-binding protein [Kocuria sp. cx-455]|uniref:energy-coupling factor ABC transporter ATP-binding protein n=1 Tax=unclassified Candidatus Sulfotelmatobacter TaxID=2635724 RepID=UPI0016821C26|nr:MULTISPECIES: energy-coupling factor ABC transporter ATP-binding protein [unclassified Candidatus Sulfotelmatobacter]MBD2761364.1 energy-coupling factor ABC transporter ATP-binding protein [Kocuria sp. cx-116]MBD2764989.1 energy-coupling factor ABC transporter ATP-binding protein [Kocuria sp. cx-455]